jgi:hypothetical protein
MVRWSVHKSNTHPRIKIQAVAPKVVTMKNTLTPSHLTDLAVTYAMLLGVEFKSMERFDGKWMAFGLEPTPMPLYWHVGPHFSLYVVATRALGALGFRMRPDGELYEF